MGGEKDVLSHLFRGAIGTGGEIRGTKAHYAWPIHTIESFKIDLLMGERPVHE
jgi:hypothetical protein